MTAPVYWQQPREVTDMVDFWFGCIQGDAERINEVPKLWREKVAAMIETEVKKENV